VLTFVQRVPSMGVCPRNFHIEGDVLRVANQGLPGQLECNVTTYRISQDNGTLSDPVVLPLERYCPTVVTPRT
jgi:6-phosphogluconolactonase (cycloisomerase 2 family)